MADFGQILARVFNAATSSLSVTVTNPSAAGGDASAANQATEITKLTSIDGKTPGLSTAGGQGNKAIAAAGTPLQLTAAACTNLIISARIGNTKQVAYGFSNAVRATSGAEIGATLQPGDSVALRVNNASAIWIDAQVNGEGVSYTYTTD